MDKCTANKLALGEGLLVNRSLGSFPGQLKTMREGWVAPDLDGDHYHCGEIC